MGISLPILAPSRMPGLYRPRRPRETSLYKLTAARFDEFEQVYPTRYQADFHTRVFGFWRPVIRAVVDEFLKCGGKMGIIAFITENDSIRKILTHLGEYSPVERAPPPPARPADRKSVV